MSHKTLNTKAILNELKGQSVFFNPREKNPQRSAPLPKKRRKSEPVTRRATMPPDRQDTMPSCKPDTTPPRYHATTIEQLRKATKAFGKEAATHRFTLEEKKALADLVYTYRSQGLKTSENEITRIAVNFIIHNYRENSANSILQRVLKALHE